MSMDRLALLVTCVVVLSVCHQALGYPNGPPVDTVADLCQTMMPQHNYSAQPNDDKLPFEIVTPESECYISGEAITVTVQLNGKKNDTYFEGVFVQGRDSSQKIIGTFANNDSTLTVLDCSGAGSKNAIGHNQKAHYNNKTFTWTPPSDAKDDVKFRATIVHETEEFWVGVESAPLKLCSTNKATSYQLSTLLALGLAAMALVLKL